MTFVSLEYIDDLRQEIVELCTKSRADRPEPWQSPTVASGIECPEAKGPLKSQV